MDGWIILSRNILDWRWFKNANTFRVFVYLLLKANYEPRDFENMTIERGQVITSYPKISEALCITEAQARTAVNHLKSTGEITVVPTSKFSVITIKNYELYQGFDRQNNSQMTVKKQSDNSQITAIKQYKQINKETKHTPLPPKGDVDGFSEFWQAYPRKTAKQAALKAWNKIKPDADLQQAILNALEQQKKSVQWQKDGGQFIPYPATWLNGRRWEDMQTQAVQAPPPTYEFDPNDPYKDWR